MNRTTDDGVILRQSANCV